jgi:hypothetical protein
MIRLATYGEVFDRLKAADAQPLLTPGFCLRAWMVSDCNNAYTNGHDILLTTEGPGKVIEIHYLFRSRGHFAFAAGVDFFRYLFQEQQARIIFGMVPAFNRAARWFSRRIGGKSHGMTDTEFGEVERFSMSREDFEARYGISHRR